MNQSILGFCLKFSSINTLGENIADNVGIREAFKAYKAYAGQRPPQQTLPGLDYTPEQLFWITFGNVFLIAFSGLLLHEISSQIWCTRTRPEMYRMILEKETHSPAQFRYEMSPAMSAQYSGYTTDARHLCRHSLSHISDTNARKMLIKIINYCLSQSDWQSVQRQRVCSEFQLSGRQSDEPKEEVQCLVILAHIRRKSYRLAAHIVLVLQYYLILNVISIGEQCKYLYDVYVLYYFRTFPLFLSQLFVI